MDEAGDEGFTWRPDGSGASPWLVMTAVIVDAADDLAVSHAVDRIKARLNFPDARKPLHWVERRRHIQRKVIIQEVAGEPITVVVIGINKKAVTVSFLKRSPALYLYATRLLLERVSWFVGDAGARVDCVFENKTALSYDALRAYVTSLMATAKLSQMRSVIDGIRPTTKGQSKMLQIADVCAGAAYAALAEDEYGNHEPSYLTALSPRLYRRGGNVFSYGLKLFPAGAAALAKRPGYEWLLEFK